VHFVGITLVLVSFKIPGKNESSHTNVIYVCVDSDVDCVVFMLCVRMEKVACCVDGRHESSPQYVYMYET